jgi:hypothetical protein
MLPDASLGIRLLVLISSIILNVESAVIFNDSILLPSKNHVLLRAAARLGETTRLTRE